MRMSVSRTGSAKKSGVGKSIRVGKGLRSTEDSSLSSCRRFSKSGIKSSSCCKGKSKKASVRQCLSDVSDSSPQSDIGKIRRIAAFKANCTRKINDIISEYNAKVDSAASVRSAAAYKANCTRRVMRIQQEYAEKIRSVG